MAASMACPERVKFAAGDLWDLHSAARSICRLKGEAGVRALTRRDVKHRTETVSQPLAGACLPGKTGSRGRIELFRLLQLSVRLIPVPEWGLTRTSQQPPALLALPRRLAIRMETRRGDGSRDRGARVLHGKAALSVCRGLAQE